MLPLHYPPVVTAMGIEPISASERNAGALTVMLRCCKHWVGLEPTINGFADHRLTTWLPMQECIYYLVFKVRYLALLV